MASKRKPYIRLMCQDCKNLNYATHKSLLRNRKEEDKKLEFKKFCNHCKKHTLHKESKK
ncbi:50S ribosomal protein L33 [Patescibacteria group bacterium]|nr:50S ribosomal protein L33 [Patescibacteria group bacterium]MCH8048955.1 50S ribosomal protein L33 [Patescibacteria group bacterium]